MNPGLIVNALGGSWFTKAYQLLGPGTVIVAS